MRAVTIHRKALYERYSYVDVYGGAYQPVEAALRVELTIATK
jgi:hypothetical protein